MPKYNIAFATDENYLPYTFVVCQSIIDSISKQYRDVSSDDSIIFHILTDKSVDIADLQLKANSFQERNKAIIDNLMVIHNIDVDQFAFCKGWGLHASKSTYYRLLLSELLDPSIKEILYLDVDTLVLKDIRDLFDNTDLSNHVAAVVLDPIIANASSDSISKIYGSNDKKQGFNVKLSTYFNAGMLLINLDKWRQDNIGLKCIDLIKFGFPLLDQDALNIAIPNPLIIDGKWNVQTTIYYGYEYNPAQSKFFFRTGYKELSPVKNPKLEEGIISSIEDPAILHFNAFKPWQSQVNSYINNTQYICNDNTYELIQLWQQTASKVIEFSNQLRNIKFDQLMNANILILQLQSEIRSEVKARRRMRKHFALVLFVLLMIQISMFLYID